MKFRPPVETWEITGPGLPPLRVRATTFGEALQRAKKQNPGYCAGWLAEED